MKGIWGNGEIRFRGWLFKTKFNFMNKKARNDYFNNLLINNISLFRDKQREYFFEKLHVINSWYRLFKIFIFPILIIIVFMPENTSKIIGISIAIICSILCLFQLIRFHIFLRRYVFTLYINSDDEFMISYQEEAIKLLKKN
jgi:hypothetical protein